MKYLTGERERLDVALNADRDSHDKEIERDLEKETFNAPGLQAAQRSDACESLPRMV